MALSVSRFIIVALLDNSKHRFLLSNQDSHGLLARGRLPDRMHGDKPKDFKTNLLGYYAQALRPS
jgi:hypothetical protein